MDKETKQEFKKIEKEFESLARMIKRGFDNADKKSDKKFQEVHRELDSLKLDMEEVKLKLDRAAYRFELEDLEKRVRKIELKLNLSKS